MSIVDTLLKFSNVTLSKTIAHDVAENEECQAKLLAMAQSVAAEAKSIAPYDAADKDHYRDGIVAVMTETAKTHTKIARVNANNFKSGWIEFGTVNMPAQHVLTRASEGALGVSVQAAKFAQAERYED